MSKKEDVWQWWALQPGPRCRLPTTAPGRGGAEAPLEAVQSAVNSQGSCFLSWCHLPVSVRRAVGQSPQPPFPPCLPLLAVVSKQESSLFTECPTASGSSRRPLHQSSGSHTRRLQAPEPTAALPGGPSPFAWCAPPQFSDRVQDSVGLSSLLTADVAQSPLSKVCDFKQLLLLSVSHWCGSLCTVKRPTSGC